MKLNSLQIKNFRMLENFEVKKLGRLNLIVGKNNSGKSTVLEALRIYAEGANRSLLIKIANSHDEIDSMDEAVPVFESLFTGRNFPIDEKSIVIGASENSDKSIDIKHVYYFLELVESDDKTGRHYKRTIVEKSKLNDLENHNALQPALLVSQDKKISLIGIRDPRSGDLYFPDREKKIPCSYIPTQFVSLDDLAEEWDKIALTDYEKYIKNALHFIESDFESLAFIERPKSLRGSRRFPIVKMKNIEKPIPLNSMGDGMLRVLQLALKIFAAKGGFLLIDEFENGLHFSIQEKIWNWLFDLAVQLDIQVFATTHSWDCVESFSKVFSAKKNAEGILFRVGRSVRLSDKDCVIATEFDAEQLANITQSEVEVR